jgi:hypothetical protein
MPDPTAVTVWSAYEEDGDGALYATEAIAKLGAIAIWEEICRLNQEAPTGPYTWHESKYVGLELVDGGSYTSVFVTEQPVRSEPVDYGAVKPCGCPTRSAHHSHGCMEG